MKTSLYEQWAEVYEMLGMSQEFNSFYSHTPIIQPFGELHPWLIPVITGVTVDKLFKCFREKGMKINDLVGLEERRCTDLIECSSLVCTDNGKNLPVNINSRPEQILGLMSVEEYFLLSLWHLVAYDSCLDDSSVTVCSGTRLGYTIPQVFYCSDAKEINVAVYSGTVTSRRAPRLIYRP
jgi:hypothetical protein